MILSRARMGEYPFMVTWHMDYLVLIGSDALGGRFSLRVMPLTLLIHRTGRIAVSHAGKISRIFPNLDNLSSTSALTYGVFRIQSASPLRFPCEQPSPSS